MNDIMKLVNEEFQRIKKPYFISLILFFVISKIVTIDMFVSDFIEYEYAFEFSNLFDMTSYDLLLMISSNFFVLKMDLILVSFISIILIYSICTWCFDNPKREEKFNFNTYISKFLIVINMIFGYFAMYLLFMLGFIIVCDLVIGISLWDKLYFLYDSFIIRYHYLEFLIINILGTISLISLIFAWSVVVVKKNAIIGGILSVIIYVGYLQVFSYLILFRKSVLIYLLIINIICIVLSTICAKKMLLVNDC